MNSNKTQLGKRVSAARVLLFRGFNSFVCKQTNLATCLMASERFIYSARIRRFHRK